MRAAPVDLIAAHFASCAAGSTITVTNWPGDVFAEGYHVPHHLKAAEHYTLCRVHFDTHRSFYAAHNCVVLHGSDPLGLWANLVTSNFGYFAARFEDFSGEMSPGQKAAFCRYRTRPLGSKPANELEASAVALAAKAQKAAAQQLADADSAPGAAKKKRKAAVAQAHKGTQAAPTKVVTVKAL